MHVFTTMPDISPRWRFRTSGFLLFLIVWLITSAHFLRAAPPNVILLISDDQRPDTIAALGNRVIETPSLDRLVDSGTAFTRAFCANPICTPSRGELLTGLSGFVNGIRNFGHRPNEGIEPWPETFRQQGYQTCFVGKWHHAGQPIDWGFTTHRGLFRGGGARWSVPSFDWNGRPVTGYRGWMARDRSGNPDLQFPIGLEPGISERFADAAIAFLRTRNTSQPFLLQVSFTAPHDPLLMPFGREQQYDVRRIPVPRNFLPEHPFDHGNLRGRDEQLWEWPRTEAAVRSELAVYYAVLSDLDKQIGRILGTLSDLQLTGSTYVVFTSDHGLGLGSHGIRGKQNMYAHTIQIPLIFSGPKIPSAKRIDAIVNLRDIYPTLAEYCDLQRQSIPRTTGQGHSLVDLVNGTRQQLQSYQYGYFLDKQRMVTDGRWKLIWYPESPHLQLFDLHEDPQEMMNLAGTAGHSETETKLKDILTQWQQEQQDPARRIPAGFVNSE